MIIIIESIILCLIFTLLILISSKNLLSNINNYPPLIIKRCKELNLINDNSLPKSKKVIIKKLIVLIIFIIIFVLLLKYINKVSSFKDSFITSYIIWLIVDWYDAIVLDIIWFCHSKRFIIPGTEDMIDEYHNYKFHIIGSLKGMLIGLFASLIVSLIIEVL